MWLFLAFLSIPLVEIALFIQVGGFIGLWPTLGIVVLTAILGTLLVRSQGAMALNNVRNSFSRLDDPTEPLAHGAMILVAGVLLLTPGFFTDGVGFALLAPPVRSWVIQRAKSRMNVQRFEMGGQGGPFGHPHQPQPHPQDDIIDADFEDLETPRGPRKPGSSGWTRH